MVTVICVSTVSGGFNVTGNWSTGVVPVAGDTIIFNGTGTAALTTNLNQSGVAFAAIYVDQTSTAQIGTLTAAGVATYFQHAAPGVYIGQSNGGGSPPG